jgi:hypothetical protein
MARRSSKRLPAELLVFRLKEIEMQVPDAVFDTGDGSPDFTGVVNIRVAVDPIDSEEPPKRQMFALNIQAEANATGADTSIIYSINANFQARFRAKSSRYGIANVRDDRSIYMEFLYPLVKQAISHQIQLASLWDFGPPWSMDFSEENIQED